MSFIADKQTLDDLNLMGQFKANSIYNLFNQVHTVGATKRMEAMFRFPLTDAVEINKRSDLFNYFGKQHLTFPFWEQQFNVVEQYLYDTAESNLLFAGYSTMKKQVLSLLIGDEQYKNLLIGLEAAVTVLNTLAEFICKLSKKDNPYTKQLQLVQSIFTDPRLVKILALKDGSFSWLQVIKYDYLLRYQLQKEIKMLIEVVYDLDVYISVGNIAESKNFVYAVALSKHENRVQAEELRHPGLNNAVANSVSLRQESNVLFLTGANMAGKSTFMKTFGTAMYLAHMGFPIAGRSLVFSVKDGIYSSINVPDNLNMGYSHFYAEVLRVKKVAEEVSDSKDLYVIFDELFKGTNVKDAYDATLAVTKAFAENRNCFFIISTHIIEVGEALRDRCKHMQFSYLPTVLDGNKPRYTYKLQEGITTDRQGMMIIENEGILEILKGSSSENN